MFYRLFADSFELKILNGLEVCISMCLKHFAYFFIQILKIYKDSAVHTIAAIN